MQMLKFAAQSSSRVLGNHYLRNTVDGTSVYQGVAPRSDIVAPFRAATMKINPDVKRSLPSDLLEELKEQEEYIAINQRIGELNNRIEAETDQEKCDQYKAERVVEYRNRSKLEKAKLKDYQKNAKRVHPNHRNSPHHPTHLFDECETDFDRISHLMPERRRLSQALFQSVPLRSSGGIAAIKDLITLRTDDCRIAYQDVLRPSGNRCPVSSCNIDMERLGFFH